MSWIWKTPISKFHDSFEECSRPCLGQSTRWVETNPLVFWCWIIHVHQLRISLLAGYLRLALLCRPLFWLRTGWWIVIFPNTLLGMIMYDTLSSTNRGFEHCHTSTCLFRKSGFLPCWTADPQHPYSKFWLGIFQRMFFYFLDLLGKWPGNVLANPNSFLEDSWIPCSS